MMATTVSCFFLARAIASAKCAIATRVEIRVRFIEHNKAWIAEERACQADPLLLTSRTRGFHQYPIWVS